MKSYVAVLLFTFGCASIAVGGDLPGADVEWLGYSGASTADTLDSTAIERQGGAPQPKGCATGWEWSIDGGIAHCVVSQTAMSVSPLLAPLPPPPAYMNARPEIVLPTSEVSSFSGSWCPNEDCLDHSLLIIDPWSPFGGLDPDFQPWHVSYN